MLSPYNNPRKEREIAQRQAETFLFDFTSDLGVNHSSCPNGGKRERKKKTSFEHKGRFVDLPLSGIYACFPAGSLRFEGARAMLGRVQPSAATGEFSEIKCKVVCFLSFAC